MMYPHTLATFSFYSSCLWLFFALSLSALCLCDQNSGKKQCIAAERLVLIEFKESLVDSGNRLSSWSDEDCCRWSGVVCNNLTHHVEELRLGGPNDDIYSHCHGPICSEDELQEGRKQMLGGIISPSLIKLEQLRHLDLSCNGFGFIPIPSFIGSLHNLRYLNLSRSEFAGEIPYQLGNLSALLVLDVHEAYSFLGSENLKWIENLKHLQYLDMSSTDLTEAVDWLHSINTLSSLQELHLSSCGLTQIPSEPTTVSFSSLILLDLSKNHFNGLLPGWVFSLRDLITLDISGCSIIGLESLGDFNSMPSLKILRLSRNPFVNTSSFLDRLSSLSNLHHLDVSYCHLKDPIFGKLQNLSQIVHLDLSYNYIVEKIPESLSNLCNLTTLNLQQNSFSGDLTELFERFCECESPKLESLALNGNNLTGQLPEKLGRLKNLASIDIAWNRLTGSIPRSLGDLSSLEALDLSHNSLTGVVTQNHFANLTALSSFSVGDNNLAFDLVNDWIPPFQLKFLRLGSCSIGPLFPSWLQSQTNLENLDISNATISDTIPNWFWSTFSSVWDLNISHNNIMGKLGDVSAFRKHQVLLDLHYNQFHGELPLNFTTPDFYFLDLSFNDLSGSLDQFLGSAIQEPRRLNVLNLANNNISGGLPNFWMYCQNLEILKLENNKLTGRIPASLGNMTSLKSLNIQNNKLSGEIPMSIWNPKRLWVVKLAENELTGKIPASIEGNNTSLKILSLRSNKLSGEIPNALCGLASIQVIDLADNNLSGSLPNCFKNFTVFSGKEKPSDIIPEGYSFMGGDQQTGSLLLVTKGNYYLYTTILSLVTTIDLSNNKLSGSIPEELVSLPGLRFLNLSHNRLRGRIPNTFSEMRVLESLDLSVNNLDGDIPLSLAGLTTLSWLNVSYNNLTGIIPKGPQIQTFNESSFIGNALCGAPLPGCRENNNDTNGTDNNHDEADDGRDWILVICMTVGLAVGFWMTIGTMIVSKRWRDAYYHFLGLMRIRVANFIHLVCIYVSSIFTI